jgi:TIR domain
MYFEAARGGRGAQAHRLLQHLCRLQPPPDSISLVGDRRFGKTSLLGFLKEGAARIPRLVVLAIDMQTLPEQTSTGFYTMLTRALVRVGELPPRHPPLTYLDFVDLLHDLQASARWMVLFIDEFDAVARDRRFTLDFFDNLRSCASVLPLTLVVASVAPLSAVAHSALYGSPFFNIFNLERLVPLSLSEAQFLIHQAPEGTCELAEVADEIIAMAGFHPFFLQRACACAWDLCNANDELDVARLRQAFAATIRDHFQYVWDHSTKDEKTALYSLASGHFIGGAALETLVERGYCRDGVRPEVSSSAFKAFILERSEDCAPQSVASARRHTFVSYSHKDKKWVDELHKMLVPLLRNGAITIWDDTKIKNGVRWDDEIQNALAQAGMAILLVSDNFLASDYIMERELPFILTAAKNEELSLLWVLLGPCLYKETEIDKYQAAHDPSKPLSSLSKVERKAALLSLCTTIKSAAEHFLAGE